MRKALMAVVGAFAALTVAGLFTRRPTRHGEPAATVEPRAARALDLSRQALPADSFARVASLWVAGSQCRVATVWGERPAQAAFAATMRVSLRTPLIAAAKAAETAAWVAREQIELAPANDADVAKRLVSVEPGAAPVVRILRAASFRPRRATFGAQEAIAA